MLHFLDHRTGEWYPAESSEVKNLKVTSLQLNKDVQYLVIMLTLDPLMYHFNLQTTRVKTSNLSC